MSMHSNNGKLLVAMELSNNKWRLAFSVTGEKKIRQKTVEARDRRGVLAETKRAKEKLADGRDLPVLCCYEAGRDGFWIQRWLEHEGFECLVIDPSSIEVKRRKRRAKTDRLDAESMVRLLRRYFYGEDDAFRVVRVPKPEEEDAMRTHRELERLKKERTAHLARIKSLLVLHGIRVKGSLKGICEDLDGFRRWNGEPLPSKLKAEISREATRLEQINEHVATVENERKEALKNPETNAQKQTCDLLRLKGVGVVSSWALSHEFFGWRDFRNRREVGALSGLTPTPYDSGGSQVEQGISKSGNRRVRRIMIELGWQWVRFQPYSELTKWFERRYAHGSKRMRRIGIVALARKLLIALWKYVEFGEVPVGAIMA